MISIDGSAARPRSEQSLREIGAEAIPFVIFVMIHKGTVFSTGILIVISTVETGTCESSYALANAVSVICCRVGISSTS